MLNRYWLFRYADRTTGNDRQLGLACCAPVRVPGQQTRPAALEHVDAGDDQMQAADLALTVHPKWTDPDGKDVVPHGFRSTFRDWATDWTRSPTEIVDAARRGEIVEVAPAHALDDKTEEAYRRTEMLEKRRPLMAQWADFCTRPVAAGDVVPLRTEAAAATA